MPIEKEAAGFYTSNYQNYAKSSAPFVGQLFRIMSRRVAAQFAKQFGKFSNILDFGCNQGAFLEELSKQGCQNLYGYDVVPLETPLKHAQFFLSLDEIRKSGIKFDVIRMNHVIEHLTDVDGTMKDLASILNPGGQIVGQTPNAQHYTSRLFGQFWGPLHFPYHTILFTELGLRGASSRWGLRFKRVRATPQPTGWAMSFENMIKAFSGSQQKGRSQTYILLLVLAVPMVLFDFLLARHIGTAIFDFYLTSETNDPANLSPR